jgi:hypothetical protein
MSKNHNNDGVNFDEPPFCTICGEDLPPKENERMQIRWESKNSGVCEQCIIMVRHRIMNQKHNGRGKKKNIQKPHLVYFMKKDDSNAQINANTPSDSLDNNVVADLDKMKDET